MADWSKDPKDWKEVIPNIPFNLNIPGTDARKAGVLSRFYSAYTDDVAKKKFNSTALSVKASWIVNATCSDTYAVICASNLFKAANDFINAINQIRNHDCCCKQGGDDDQASNAISDFAIKFDPILPITANSPTISRH